MTAIRGAVAEEHEVECQAVVLIGHGTILKTSSGKIQRQACRAAFLEGTLNVIGEWHRPPATEAEPAVALPLAAAVMAAAPGDRRAVLEAHLQQEVARVLRLPASSLDVKLPLSTLGIDSLTAVELKNLIEGDLQVSLPLIQVIQGPSVAELAALLLEQMEGADGSAAPQVERTEPAPRAKGDSLLLSLLSLAEDEHDA